MSRIEQSEAEITTKGYFCHHIFFFDVTLDLLYGVIGLFWMVQLVGFGLILVVPVFDWNFYLLLGLENVPSILVSEYLGIIGLGLVVYFLLWRRILTPLRSHQVIHYRMRYSLVSWALPYAGIIGSFAVLYQTWLVVISGFTFLTKLFVNLIAIPVSGLCFGSVLGRGIVFASLSRSFQLVVRETKSTKWKITITNIQILAKPRKRTSHR